MRLYSRDSSMKDPVVAALGSFGKLDKFTSLSCSTTFFVGHGCIVVDGVGPCNFTHLRLGSNGLQIYNFESDPPSSIFVEYNLIKEITAE